MMTIRNVWYSNLGIRFIGTGKCTGLSYKKWREQKIIKQKSASKNKDSTSVKAKKLTKEGKREKHEKLIKTQQKEKARRLAEKLLDKKLKLRKKMKLEIMRQNKEFSIEDHIHNPVEYKK